MNKQETKDNELVLKASYYSRHYKYSMALFAMSFFALFSLIFLPEDSPLSDNSMIFKIGMVHTVLMAVVSMYYKAKNEHIKSIIYYQNKAQ